MFGSQLLIIKKNIIKMSFVAGSGDGGSTGSCAVGRQVPCVIHAGGIWWLRDAYGCSSACVGRQVPWNHPRLLSLVHAHTTPFIYIKL